MVVTGRAHCSILLYITLQIHSVEHSYGLGGESLRETFTICIMHRSLLAVWALWWLHNAILQCVTVHRVPKFTSCHNAIMVVTGRAHCSILLYITLQIHSVEHSYGLGGESLRETFTICIMHRSLLAVWALWWLHNAILQCVTVHRVPKFTSCHNAIMVVTGRAHCSILLYITLQIHSVEHSYGLGGESLRETFTICIMHRSLLAVWALWWLHNAILQCVTVHRVPKFTSCHNAIMVVTGRAHCSILLYITLQIHSVEHSYGLGGESLRETFTICIMHRSLLAVWALWWLHNAILQCVTVHRVPKFTSCHNAIMVVTGRAHCSILLYIYIYIYILCSIQGRTITKVMRVVWRKYKRSMQD